jgi:dolichol-phosphate mannosyltransferase
MNPELSVITPVFNEAEALPAFLAALKSTLDEIGVTYEVIAINDGSSDTSEAILRGHGWKELKVVNFPINLGHQAALEAGYRSSTGNYVVSMDSDLQHPPSAIKGMLDKAVAESLDVVYGTRSDRREDSIFKRWSAKSYYRLMRGLTQIEISDSSADFRLISKKVVEVIRLLPTGQKVFRLMIPSLGFASGTFDFKADARIAGVSKYSFTKMLGLLVTSVVSFSVRPLWLSVQLGLIFGLISLLGIGYTVTMFALGETVPGWASTSSAILLLFAINFMVMGVFGIYLGELVKSAKSSGLAAKIIENSKAD